MPHIPALPHEPGPAHQRRTARLRLTLVDAEAAVSRDVEVELPTLASGGPATAGAALADVEPQLAAALDAAVRDAPRRGGVPAVGRRGATARRDACWWSGPVTVTTTTPLGSPPLVHGAVLRRGGSSSARALPRGAALQLHVVAGPDAGHVVALPPGDHVVGRAPGCTVRLEDPDLSRRHLLVRVGRAGTEVRDLAATNGVRLDGVALPAPGRLAEGARVRAGSSTLVVRVGAPARAVTQPDGRGHLRVQRAPRTSSRVAPTTVRLPEDPPPPPPVRVPWVAMLVPLAVAVPMALLWSPWALAMGLASPLMAVGTVVTDRRHGRRTHARELAAVEETRARARQRAAAAVALEEEARRASSPDPGTVVTACTGPTRRLWERRRADDDALALSVGLGRLPSAVRLDRAGDVRDAPGPAPEVPEACDVPLVVPLTTSGVVCVTGPRDGVLALARWLVLQVVALHAPADVALTLLAPAARGDVPTPGDEGTDDWSWARWLPHLEAGALATTPQAVARALDELTAELDRRAVAGGAHPPPADDGPRHVVVLDGPVSEGSRAAVARLLREGPARGVHVVCIVPGEDALPGECGVVVQLDAEAGTTVRVSAVGAGTTTTGTVVGVGVHVAARAARALAPLREADPVTAPGRLPDRVTLSALLPRAPVAATGGAGGQPCAADVLSLWDSGDPRGVDRAVPLGMGTAGTFRLDLPGHGPHALVAGTTGAGKSELLRTLVVSLAYHHPPQDLSLVLVDYKGGAAFATCTDLPHVVGLVTDLDSHLTARALRSLGAEVSRRERLLRDVGAGDLAEYRRRRLPGSPVLGRLVLVVDEYRVLAEELPDFVSGLVRLAAVGRSLGLHLVLATQRPAGVVGPDVAANINLRVALRVRDEHDSLDVVESRDAARLPAALPGRALLRTGGGPLLEVQVASVTDGSARVPGPPAVRPWPAETGDVLVDDPGDGAEDGAEDDPDGGGELGALVDAVRSAAVQRGAPVPASPWLPPLPEQLGWSQHWAPRPDDEQGPVLRWGLLDAPDAQAWRPLEWRLGSRTSLLVVGGPRSGRTGVARAVLTAAALQTDPTELHLHVLDASGALREAEDLPHVGAVVGREDPERGLRLLRRLTVSLEGRRARADRPRAGDPPLVLVVDGWDVLGPAWEASDGGESQELLRRLVREGPGAGVLVLLTGDRATATGPLGAGIADRLVLRTADPTDALLVGLAPRDLPARMPPGRGVRLGGSLSQGPDQAQDRPREVQVALPGQELGELARRLARCGPDASGPVGAGAGPAAVPRMPDRVEDTSPALGRRGGGGPAAGLLLGVGGDDVLPLALCRASDGPVVVVAGHPGSGRTTALAVLARSALAQGWTTLAVAAGRVPGDAWEDVAPGAVLGVPGSRAAALAEELTARLERVRTARAATAAGGAPTPPLLVLVDDADLLEGTPVGDVLAGLAAQTAGPGVEPGAEAQDLLVLAGSTPTLLTRYSGPLAAARRLRSGVLLGPTGPLDGDVVGVALPRRGEERRPGRGLLVRRGRTLPLQVAVPGAPRAGTA